MGRVDAGLFGFLSFVEGWSFVASFILGNVLRATHLYRYILKEKLVNEL